MLLYHHNHIKAVEVLLCYPLTFSRSAVRACLFRDAFMHPIRKYFVYSLQSVSCPPFTWLRTYQANLFLLRC
nr:MAG TPA: hypothetical protein [Caudoviricetes sp.]